METSNILDSTFCFSPRHIEVFSTVEEYVTAKHNREGIRFDTDINLPGIFDVTLLTQYLSL